ncbi:Protein DETOXIFICATION [Rhynchospora pubera]|uniref:Protein DETOXIFICATION n=1 Tax=Rhynchospora pubera TaxID=906938 RepID=A0AAV8DZT0_9POAL|nr:Protein DETOXIFICATION [Rhynchospora pubera]
MCECGALTQCRHHLPTHLTPLLKKKTPKTANEVDQAGWLVPVVEEARSLLALSIPMIMSGLLLYLRSMISMLFLGRLGRLPLAGGSLALGFANITGYSVLSGLAMGMEPICAQAVGAGHRNVLTRALQRTIVLLLIASLPISALWISMRQLLLACGQDPDIATAAQSYILFSLPDLLLQSFLHPIRIYLRTQSITLPLSYAAFFALIFHFPINYLLVSILGLGIEGVAIASVLVNFNLLLFLSLYTFFSGVSKRTGDFDADNASSNETIVEWKSLLNLAIPSCISVCLEWWWYEIMIMLCGLLADPKSTVASMGILIQTTSLIYIFPSSLSYSVSTRVGNELGAGQPDRASRAARVGIACGAALGVIALCFTIIVKDIWARQFTSDASILHLTASVLPILGIAELGNCPQTTGCGILRGSARPRAAANINLGAFYGVGMPVAVGLAFWAGKGLTGMWLGMLAAQMACVMFMLVSVKHTDWTLQTQRAQRLTGKGGGGNDDVGRDNNICVVIEKDDKVGFKIMDAEDGEETGWMWLSL